MSLDCQQELLIYKRDTEAKILLLQSRYNDELNRINSEKRTAINNLSKKLESESIKRNISNRNNLTVESPLETSKSFVHLRQDTGSTGPKVIEHIRKNSEEHIRNRKGSYQVLKQALENSLQIHKNTESKIPFKYQQKKSHRKSTKSLNISKIYDRLNSKSKFMKTLLLL
jgi:hypothetical protein